MMIADDFEALCEHLCLWQSYDPAVRADLYSTAIHTASGIFLVDPISLQPAALKRIVLRHSVAGVVITNSNHCRAAFRFSEKFAAPIFAHPVTSANCGFPSSSCMRAGQDLATDLHVIEIDGAVPGEIALYGDRQGGTMIVGDTLINFEPYGFTFLPEKYCSNARQMRCSLRQLLDYEFERMVFAHGTPLVAAARKRLEQLLNAEN